MRKALAAVAAIVLLQIGAQAVAQSLTVGDLRAKGAAVLSAEEVKSLLTGATVRYDGPQFRVQFKMETNGRLFGSYEKLAGSASVGSLTGDWKVTEEGR